MVWVHFAPRQTGFRHIGGPQTALFHWFYARHMNGTFILGIEDTDRERHGEEAANAMR
jgi:glutamyl-tRNA synthetase